jgi:hypothetical protein
MLCRHTNYLAYVKEGPTGTGFLNAKPSTLNLTHIIMFCRHTNYLAYVKEGPTGTGFLNAAAVYRINRWVTRIHCHKNVKLSDAVQSLPHQVHIYMYL